jgi:hypothetical protein
MRSPATGDAVADQADAESEDHQHRSRDRRDPPGAEQVTLAARDDRAEVGARRLLAEAQVRHARQHQHVDDDVDRRVHEARADQIGQGVTEYRAHVAVPEGLGGHQERLLAHREHLGAGQTGVEGPAGDDDADGDALQARADDGDDRQDQHDERERDDRVGDAPDDRVEPPAHVARDRPDDDADGEAQVGDHGDHQHVDAQSVEHAAPDVAPDEVGAHPVVPRGRLQAVEHVNLVRRVRGDQRRQQRRDHQHCHDDDASRDLPTAEGPKAPPRDGDEAREVRHRGPRDARVGRRPPVRGPSTG